MRDLNDPFELLYSPNLAPAEILIKNRLRRPDFLAELRKGFPNDTDDELRARVLSPEACEAVRAQYPQLGEQGLEARLDSADATMRLICFSSEQVSPCDEILLWSHYANKHRGHRIGFRIPPCPKNSYSIDPVHYDPKRVEVFFNGNEADPNFLGAMIKSIYRKNPVWAYEWESRLLVRPETCVHDEKDPQMEHLQFDPSWVVRVDCGIGSDDAKNAKIVSLVRERYAHAKVYKARCHPTAYSIEYDLGSGR